MKNFEKFQKTDETATNCICLCRQNECDFAVTGAIF